MSSNGTNANANANAMPWMGVKLRLAMFSALLLLSLSLACATSSLLTDFWVQADSMRRNGTESGSNKMNSGLFFGARQLDWAFGPKRKLFSVFDELQSGVGFMDRHTWFGILLSAGLGLLWNVVGIFVALRSATMEDRLNQGTALGPLGICLWALLGSVSYGLCLAIFHLQFQGRIRTNVLLPEEIAAGFSSENCPILGFSFLLMACAVAGQLASLFLVFAALHFGKSANKLGREGEEMEKDESVFIY